VIFAGEAEVDAPADMANRKLPEAITAPTTPSRIGLLILMILLLRFKDWTSDDAEGRPAIEHVTRGR
jgi:hypothetical protein